MIRGPRDHPSGAGRSWVGPYLKTIPWATSDYPRDRQTSRLLVLAECLRGFHLRRSPRRQVSAEDCEPGRTHQPTCPDPPAEMEPSRRFVREPREVMVRGVVDRLREEHPDTNTEDAADQADQAGLAEDDHPHVALGRADRAEQAELAAPF